MKKILIALMGVMGLMSLMGCDKIEPDANGRYAVFAGSAATWTDGTPIANPVQHAYVEKYTGPICNNCPDADRTLEAAHTQFGDTLVLVSVNSKDNTLGAPGPDSPDMRTEDGAIWEDFWNIQSIPAAYINRSGSVYTSSMADISAGIRAAIDESPVVALEGSVSGSSEISVDVNLQFIQAYTNPVTLTLVLTQDSLRYFQIDGTQPVYDYVHNHMLRDVITDVWGADIDCTGAVGECRKATFRFPLPDGMEHWHVVALVSDKESRRVLNSVQCN